MAALERGAGGAFEFNGLNVGPRRYGAEMSTTATSGPVQKAGYLDRDRRRAARKKVLQGMISTDPVRPQPAQQIYPGQG